jgi:L-arabinose isomerase
MGNRFRLIVNQVNLVEPEQPLPKLPVARAIWRAEPDLKVAATAWILAGGSHHTSLSKALTVEHLQDFADIAGLECLRIDANTNVRSFSNELKWNDLYYHLSRAL